MFITCSFNADAQGRAYTYQCDIPEEVTAGDKVVVVAPDGTEKTVTVVDVDVSEPPFVCKPIVRLHVPEDEFEPAGPDAGDGHEGDGGY